MTRSDRSAPCLVVRAAVAFAATVAWPAATAAQVAATPADFAGPGTQPDPALDTFYEGIGCANCHGSYDANTAPFRSWIASMMAQSARDPIWHASLAIANQDVPFSGQACIRCHAPTAWLGDRHADGTTAGFDPLPDFDGVTCTFCHRMVNPEAGSLSAVGYSDNDPYDPDPDEEILSALAAAGTLPGPGMRSNGAYVVDPRDARRGPFDDVPVNYHGVPMHHSPFHSTG